MNKINREACMILLLTTIAACLSLILGICGHPFLGVGLMIGVVMLGIGVLIYCIYVNRYIQKHDQEIKNIDDEVYIQSMSEANRIAPGIDKNGFRRSDNIWRIKGE